jgi:excinuclease UvrABC ATPase subunit
VLDLKLFGRNIAEILDMTVNQSYEFFKSSRIKKHLHLLQEVGLGYLKLGQSLSTMSGGESQRLKIATEPTNESNIYIMDEPTTGLHLSDIDNFYRIVKSLVANENAVVIIEHNLDIIKYADWIIDLGPEGGKKGGELIFQGLPEDIVNNPRSLTGKYLKNMI